MGNVSPLPRPERRPDERYEAFLFSARIWASLAKDARDMLATETYSGTRQSLEAFIDRALNRAARYYRLADAARKREEGK